MAHGATVISFDVELADVDRGVYESLSVQVARHPSETAAYVVARVLAYALEHDEGIAFSQGLFASDEPAVWIHDLTGALVAWIEVGTPDAARLHKASKAARRVAVYCHKDVPAWLGTLAGERIHAPERVSLYELDREVVEAVAEGLERRNRWSLSRTDGTVFLEASGTTWSFEIPRHRWPGR